MRTLRLLLPLALLAQVLAGGPAEASPSSFVAKSGDFYRFVARWVPPGLLRAGRGRR
jgi:hypothetical protein